MNPKCRLPGCYVRFTPLMPHQQFCCAKHRVEFNNVYMVEFKKAKARKKKSNGSDNPKLDILIRSKW